MSKHWMFLTSIILIGFLIFSWVTGTYNSLITQRTEVQTQQAQIETQLQRRFDLVPNLVESVKGGMSQEQAVFKAI
ncbi:MAG: LemA family protein, partial [Nanoarchaeota archaeon]